MIKKFHQGAKTYEKTICAAISIFCFLVVWGIVVKTTAAGKVLAGPVETLRQYRTEIKSAV